MHVRWDHSIQRRLLHVPVDDIVLARILTIDCGNYYIVHKWQRYGHILTRFERLLEVVQFLRLEYLQTSSLQKINTE